jgi:hypothetical protein
MNPPWRNPIFFAFVIIIAFLFIVGFRDSPVSNPDTFKVEPAYINGILTASGILFGIWATIIGKEPETEPQKREYPIIGEIFLVCLMLLVFSVVYVALTAVNLFSSRVALSLCMVSFIMNASSIAFTLYIYKFKN